jgi:hypothetical protein
VHQIGRREHVAQEAEPRDDRGEGKGLGRDVEKLDLEHVTRASTLHENRAGEGMDGAGLHLGHVRLGGAGAELAVDAVARRQDHLFPLVHGDERRNLWMEPVVAGGRLIPQTLTAVDLDALHGALLYTTEPS